MKWIWTSILCIWSILAIAQKEMESLEKMYAGSAGSEKAKVALLLSKAYWTFPRVVDLKTWERTKSWARTAIRESLKSHSDSLLGESLFQQGAALFYSYNYNGNFNLANDTLLLALPYLRMAGAVPSLAICQAFLGNSLHMVGQIPRALLFLDTATKKLIEIGDTSFASSTLATLGHCYFDIGDYKNAYEIGIRAINLSHYAHDTFSKVYSLTHLLNLYLASGLPELALQYFHQILKWVPAESPEDNDIMSAGTMRWAKQLGGEAYMISGLRDSTNWIAKYMPYDTTDFYSMQFYGKFWAFQGNYSGAVTCYHIAFNKAVGLGHIIGICQHAIDLGNAYLYLEHPEEAKKWALIGLEKSKQIHALLEMEHAAGLLSDTYAKMGDYKEAFHYNQLYKSLSDSVAPEQFKRSLFLVQVQDELDKQKQAGLLLAQENKIRDQQLNQSNFLRNVLLAGILALLVVAGLIIRNNQQRKKSNFLLREQKAKVEQSLQELKATQAQLIQREKMASLGELTAGVAHEIQNPLNFVKNFSELNNELLIDLKHELEKGNLEEVNQIASNIIANGEKITEHGKRADAIVKGMLQHSRNSSGQKEPADINALVDEYMRLAYHGLRAKDKSFNATIVTEFDNHLEKINMISQEIGRVVLNLVSNAFYAVELKKKRLGDSLLPDGRIYEPTVKVITSDRKNRVEIRVIDNGDGIPPKLMDKIFQPFFTTKPTGLGTGLGLSISYDIVTKGHGGQLDLINHEGEGAEFLISLPKK